MKLSVGFSPCPNDTFIFDAWFNGKIDLPEELEYDWHISDVEELNSKGFENSIDITKVSYHTYAKVQEKYQLLKSGGALGYNCGPLLITRPGMETTDVNQMKIAIPGQNTTANFLLSVAYPDAKNKKAVLFSEIEDLVLNGEFDAGLIIHENRFTYKDKGLIKIVDLGEYWEDEFNAPIPLGGIMIKRSLNKDIRNTISEIMRKSVEYAFSNPESSLNFMQKYSQDMRKEIMMKHVELYVNEFTRDINSEAEKAIQQFLDQHIKLGYISKINTPVFV